MTMTTADLEQLATALYDSNMVNDGRIEAHRAAIDSLFRVVAWSLPEQAGMIDATLGMLQADVRERLHPDSLKAFDNTVAAFQAELRKV